MHKSFIATIVLLATLPLSAVAQSALKQALTPHFLLGAAIDTNLVNGQNPRGAALVKENFNQVVAENCMKGESIHPEEDRYDWEDSDKLMNFAEANGLAVVGHCLVWHSQPPRWMFTDEKGDTVSREVLIDRMYHHITTVVTRYKGRIRGWDVVNEAIEDDGSFRCSPYYTIIGEDYIELAFRFAYAADPDAELYINDYSMAKPGKREAYCRLVSKLREKGCRIDAIGMQSHNGYDYPDLVEWERSIETFAALGVSVMLTEFDVNMLPNPQGFGGADISQNYAYDKAMNPYAKGLDKAGQKLFDSRYLEMFRIIHRHRDAISRVTFWGVTDANSWLNDWPIAGRTNYPLLFDRDYQAKPVVKQIVKMFNE